MKIKRDLKSALLKAHPFMTSGYDYSKEAIRKLQKLDKSFNPNKTEYCACFTPMEIISLVKIGVKLTDSSKGMFDYFLEKKKKGICNPTWFYFYPNTEFVVLKERVENESKGM